MSRKVAYNVKNVNFMVDGHRVRDYGEGDIIQVERQEDYSTLHTGAMGEYIFSIMNDDSAVITLTLLQDSLSLPLLRDLAEERVIFPCSLVDMNDNIIKSGEHCMIQSIPYTRAEEAGDVEITILCGRWG